MGRCKAVNTDLSPVVGVRILGPIEDPQFRVAVMAGPEDLATRILSQNGREGQAGSRIVGSAPSALGWIRYEPDWQVMRSCLQVGQRYAKNFEPNGLIHVPTDVEELVPHCKSGKVKPI